MAKIQELIAKQDGSEIVRDKIAAILVDEIAQQKVYAAAAGEDPRMWDMRVFLESSNPLSEFLDPDVVDQANNLPIVNVQLESYTPNSNASNVVERQNITANYNIDVYAVGISADVFGEGHQPGDELASLMAQRGVRLVRNILQSSFYTYLALPGIVGSRSVESVTVFQPQLDNRAVEHVIAARISFAVRYNEFSPQDAGAALEQINVIVNRKETGEVYLVAQYDFP